MSFVTIRIRRKMLKCQGIYSYDEIWNSSRRYISISNYCTTTTLCVLHFICLRAGDNINIDHPCLWSHMKKQVCELELTFHPFLVTQTTASNNLQQL